MNLDWHQIWGYLYGNRVPIGGTAMLVVTAAVKVWPNPDVKWWSVQTFKQFFYDFSHQTLNITTTPRNKEESVTNPKA